MDARLSALETAYKSIREEIDLMKTSVAKLTDDTSQILSIVAGAKGTAALVAKHGPRVFAAFVGYLVATGKVDQKLATFLGSIFGIG